ncbi:hypothetical protein B484DRAFT_3071 [Ochromonadaceae sp. CCMP2298]|nr:hypothetical protein B484DRAFT_3071 [Ochromonadaceae sp. CCMP2298]
MPQVDAILACPVEHLPSEQWQREMLYAFSELRETLYAQSQQEAGKPRRVKVPAMKDEAAWHRFCLADELDQGQGQGQGLQSVQGSQGQDSVPEEMQVEAEADAVAEVEAGAVDEGAGSRDSGGLGGAGVEMEMGAETGAETEAGVQAQAQAQEGVRMIDSAWAGASGWGGAVNVSPSTSVLLQFDQVLTQRVLALHIDWLDSR